MRLLLLSDIHSNLEALEAYLSAAPKVDGVVNLGDVVGYGASPNEVVELVRSAGHLLVRGNHDKACSGITSIDYFNSVAAMAVLWTRTMLTPTNVEWLRSLPAGPVTFPGLEDVSFVHGSPLNEDQYLLVPYDATAAAQGSSSRLTFFGHTHVQGGFVFDLRNGRATSIALSYPISGGAVSFELKLDRGAGYLINPGSVGQPRDSDWRAAFAVFDSEAYSVTFHRVPYDVQLAQRRILDAELPERLATRLSLGR